jgi:APA family basic amino acid/polyamine antiporter
MSAPRVLQEMAVDGLAIKQAAEASEGRNPVVGVFAAWLPSIALILIGGFNFLLHLTIFFYMFIYVALICGVIFLRSKQPDADRPFRAWAHPWSTYLCLIVWLMIGLYDAYAEMEYTALGVLMIAASWPMYLYLTRSEKKE